MAEPNPRKRSMDARYQQSDPSRDFKIHQKRRCSQYSQPQTNDQDVMPRNDQHQHPLQHLPSPYNPMPYEGSISESEWPADYDQHAAYPSTYHRNEDNPTPENAPALANIPIAMREFYQSMEKSNAKAAAMIPPPRPARHSQSRREPESFTSPWASPIPPVRGRQDSTGDARGSQHLYSKSQDSGTFALFQHPWGEERERGDDL